MHNENVCMFHKECYTGSYKLYVIITEVEKKHYTVCFPKNTGEIIYRMLCLKLPQTALV